MKPISSAASNTPLSLIRVIFNRIIGMDDVISFAVGEPDFGTPPHVIDAATATIRNDRIGYTDNSGIKQLREAVAREFHRFDRIDYDPATEIMVTNGGMEGVFLTLAALTNPGDEVLVADPCYANYEGTIALNRCTTVPVPTREETGFDLEEGPLRRAITDRSKVILINSPSNPTGATASRESLEMIARVAVEKDLYVLFDEVYKHLVYGGREYFNIARLPGMKERTFCIDSVSKAYAMTGWRIGYVLGPERGHQVHARHAGAHAQLRQRPRPGGRHRRPRRRPVGHRDDAAQLPPPARPHGGRRQRHRRRELQHPGRRLLRLHEYRGDRAVLGGLRPAPAGRAAGRGGPRNLIRLPRRELRPALLRHLGCADP
ncbi:MAG: aminotransferase class I/II-fold pyridoxal phosphate-dependent enzyme [Acidipropionibacterium sp.]|nr:aminotransferase class I/II-fold pyridoxal phosphate-dependent enzyme [Acidipropionibacterium sp.]